MKNLLLSFASFAAVALSGCEKPQDTLQTLQSEVSSYSANPSEEAAAKIDANFTKLDKQIAQLREAGQAEDATTISNQRDALQAQYAAARMTASLLKAKEAAANVGEAFRKAGEAFGQALQGASTNQE
jgi:hypothetical protein